MIKDYKTNDIRLKEFTDISDRGIPSGNYAKFPANGFVLIKIPSLELTDIGGILDAKLNITMCCNSGFENIELSLLDLSGSNCYDMSAINIRMLKKDITEKIDLLKNENNHYVKGKNILHCEVNITKFIKRWQQNNEKDIILLVQ